MKSIELEKIEMYESKPKIIRLDPEKEEDICKVIKDYLKDEKVKLDKQGFPIPVSAFFYRQEGDISTTINAEGYESKFYNRKIYTLAELVKSENGSELSLKINEVKYSLIPIKGLVHELVPYALPKE